jgi:hypothetical protein
MNQTELTLLPTANATVDIRNVSAIVTQSLSFSKLQVLVYHRRATIPLLWATCGICLFSKLSLICCAVFYCSRCLSLQRRLGYWSGVL